MKNNNKGGTAALPHQVLRPLGSKGFSLPEFLIVNGIIVALIALSFPLFYHLKASSRIRGMNETIASLQADIAAWHYKLGSYPDKLDSVENNTDCGDCFSAVMEKGINNVLWVKESDTVYYFSANGNGLHNERGDFKITYDPSTGKVNGAEILDSSL